MTKALVWVEHDGSAVKDATLSAVSAAAQLGEVTLLVAGGAGRRGRRGGADRGRGQGGHGR
jgi:electron transfer flavoprotein alpha subunit